MTTFFSTRKLYNYKFTVLNTFENYINRSDHYLLLQYLKFVYKHLEILQIKIRINNLNDLKMAHAPVSES